MPAGALLRGVDCYDNGEVETKVSQGTAWTYHYDALGRLRQANRLHDVRLRSRRRGQRCSASIAVALETNAHTIATETCSPIVDNYNDMRDANTIGADKYFHCMANCEAAAGGRADVAETISDGREWVDESLKSDPASACSADRAANRHGRNSEADGEYQWRQPCSTYRPNGLSPRY